MIRLFLVVFVVVPQLLFSQIFEASVSENKIGLNESFEISFTLDDNGSKFTPPPFSDFYIISGPSQSTSTSIINGRMTQESSYKYVLKAKKIGVFTIMPANIKIKGKTIGTKPITIQVQKGVVSNKPNTPRDIVSRKIHLEVKANKNQCYIGEPIVLTYRLYFNLNIGNLSPERIKYSGFWTELIDIDSETRKTTYKGKSYNSAIIKQVVLIPQSKGEKNIEKLSVELVANLPTNRRDFFGMISTQSVNYTVVSNDLLINVLDLPKENKPVNFSGAVGNFNLNVDLDKSSINVNESATFEVKISGSGNLNLLTSPTIEFDNELEVFDPKHSEKIKVNNRGVSGYKSEEYLIVPRYKGIYNLKPIEFTFFNPKTKKYISLKSSQKKINVVADKFDSGGGSTSRTVGKEKVDLINEDIKFIKTSYNISVFKRSFVGSSFFYILFFIPFLILLFAVLYKKDYLTQYISFKQDILKIITNKLNQAHLHLQEKELQKFYSLLLEIMFLYISKKFYLDRAQLSVENIQEVLMKNNIDKKVILEYLDLIKNLELYKYSSIELTLGKKNKELHARVTNVISQIQNRL